MQFGNGLHVSKTMTIHNLPASWNINNKGKNPQKIKKLLTLLEVNWSPALDNKLANIKKAYLTPWSTGSENKSKVYTME